MRGIPHQHEPPADDVKGSFVAGHFSKQNWILWRAFSFLRDKIQSAVQEVLKRVHGKQFQIKERQIFYVYLDDTIYFPNASKKPAEGHSVVYHRQIPLHDHLFLLVDWVKTHQASPVTTQHSFLNLNHQTLLKPHVYQGHAKVPHSSSLSTNVFPISSTHVAAACLELFPGMKKGGMSWCTPSTLGRCGRRHSRLRIKNYEKQILETVKTC